MNIGFLANSNLAIPTLQHLLSHQKLTAVGVPDKTNEYTQQIMMRSRQGGIPPSLFSRDQLQLEMEEWIQLNALDVVLVYTFPWLIPETCLQLPELGFFNAHFAPLPAYRGGAPLFWLIKNQEEKGGFCLHKMTGVFDEGDLVYQQDLPLSPQDTLGVHMGQLSLAAIQWTNTFLTQLESNKLVPIEQDTRLAKVWPTPELQDLIIDWANQTVQEISALVRATNPYYGGAVTFYQGSPVRILDATVLDGSSLPIGIVAGTVLNDQTGSALFVACRNLGLLRIDVIKLEEGYFSGAKLFELGVQPGTTFSTGQV